MAIAAIKAVQGYQIDGISPARRKPAKEESVLNRNTGPDTVNLSDEALALAKASRSEELAGQSSSANAAVPAWLKALLPAELLDRAGSLQQSGAALSGHSSGASGLSSPLSEDNEAYLETLFRNVADLLQSHGITTAESFAVSAGADNAFGAILRQELFKVVSADLRFAGSRSGAVQKTSA